MLIPIPASPRRDAAKKYVARRQRTARHHQP